MTNRNQLRQTVLENAAAVRAAEHRLLDTFGAGPFFVLARDKAIVKTFTSELEALDSGARLYPDGLYSVHEIVAARTFAGGNFLPA